MRLAHSLLIHIRSTSSRKLENRIACGHLAEVTADQCFCQGVFTRPSPEPTSARKANAWLLTPPLSWSTRA